VNKTGFAYWGDINQKLDLTTEEDVAKFVIAAIRDKNRVGHVKITSNELSTREIVEIYNKVLGKNEQAKNMGSLEDLRKKVQELKEKDTFESVQLGYALFMFDGSGKIKDKMNS
jgi:nucleoside-diphosphate-sugar epimerase